MIYDCCTYSGEEDMLEVRLNILDEHVDFFVIVEGTLTFSGKPKPLYFNKEKFKKWDKKIIYKVVDTYDDEDILSQLSSRNYVDTEPFKRAFYQKETIRKVLQGLNLSDDDIIYYGDCDEVWKPQEVDDKVYKLRQRAYSYFFNNRSPEDWRGTIVTRWKNLKNGCLNDMRANPVNIKENGGWHWTNLGGLEAVIKKIESYDHQEVNIPWIKDGMAERLENNEDFLGRGFKFWVDESDLPPYLLTNKEKYKHLWK